MKGRADFLFFFTMEELFLKIQKGHAHVNFVRHLIFIKYLFVKKKTLKK